MKDLISMRDLSKKQILKILEVAKEYKIDPYLTRIDREGIIILFLEPSTRTSGSFIAAAKQCGAWTIEISGQEGTSFVKGESIADTLKMYSGYRAKVVVIRTKIEGFHRSAAAQTTMSIINAGDGANQHPSQTLLDLFSIQETQERLSDLKIAFVGDLKFGRTVKSLSMGLAHFNPELFFVSPDSLKITNNVKFYLREKKIPFSEHSKMEEIIEEANILYMTRIQKERFPDSEDYHKVKDAFRLTTEYLKQFSLKKNFKILHPLPRINEIDTSVDTTPYAHYFEQAENGLHTRKAIYDLFINREI